MRKIEKEDILIPLLEKYYSTGSLLLESEQRFYNDYGNIIFGDKNLFLSKPSGIAIIVTKIADNQQKNALLNSLNSNGMFKIKNFEPEKEGGKEIDQTLFEKNAEYSFVRQVFKKSDSITTDIIDKNGKTLSFSLFISLAETNLDHHIISFIFTTYDDNLKIDDSYIMLSNTQILNLINSNKEISQIIGAFIGSPEEDMEAVIKPNEKDKIVDKNTFVGINFWRDEWKDEKDNCLDAKNYVKDNPFYFYSLLTLDEEVFRRNFENIMSYLGWCFSASRVHFGLFSRNLYISVTFKPLIQRYKYIGHDGTELRAWEVLALQNFLLNEIDKFHKEYNVNHKGETAREMDRLINELEKVYDFDAFFKKIGKGEIWIKFNTYLQDQIGISSNYDLYRNRYQRKAEEDDRKEDIKLTRLNLVLSSLIFGTIFISIIAIFLNNNEIHEHELEIFPFVNNTMPGEILNFGLSSFALTIVLSAICIIIFLIVLRPLWRKL